jgi:hypothetical protein
LLTKNLLEDVSSSHVTTNIMTRRWKRDQKLGTHKRMSQNTHLRSFAR